LTISIGKADTPSAAAPAQSKTAMVGPFGGSASIDVKNYVPVSVIRTIKKYGVVGQRSQQSMVDLAKTGSVICADTGGSYLIGGTVDLTAPMSDQYWITATVTLNGFDCSNLAGKVRSITVSAENADRQTSIDIAVANALKQYLAH
jgi:hypothetical protein